MQVILTTLLKSSIIFINNLVIFPQSLTFSSTSLVKMGEKLTILKVAWTVEHDKVKCIPKAH